MTCVLTYPEVMSKYRFRQQGREYRLNVTNNPYQYVLVIPCQKQLWLWNGFNEFEHYDKAFLVVLKSPRHLKTLLNNLL